MSRVEIARWKHWAVSAGCGVVLIATVLHAQQPVGSSPTPAAPSGRPCRAAGHVLSGDVPLPGAAVSVISGEKAVAVTSTDVDGGYIVPLAPGTYRLKVELTAFVPVERDLTVGQPPCEVQVDVPLILTSRAPA